MTRVKRGPVARHRRKKLLHFNRSFSGVHSTLFKQAKQQRMKALRSAFVGRKELKQEIRSLWIQRIQNGLVTSFVDTKYKYSTFIHALKENKFLFNRKILSQLTIVDRTTFSKLVNQVHV